MMVHNDVVDTSCYCIVEQAFVNCFREIAKSESNVKAVTSPEPQKCITCACFRAGELRDAICLIVRSKALSIAMLLDRDVPGWKTHWQETISGGLLSYASRTVTDQIMAAYEAGQF